MAVLSVASVSALSSATEKQGDHRGDVLLATTIMIKARIKRRPSAGSMSASGT
jgi:hypothetical protein